MNIKQNYIKAHQLLVLQITENINSHVYPWYLMYLFMLFSHCMSSFRKHRFDWIGNNNKNYLIVRNTSKNFIWMSKGTHIKIHLKHYADSMMNYKVLFSLDYFCDTVSRWNYINPCSRAVCIILHFNGTLVFPTRYVFAQFMFGYIPKLKG